MSRVVFIKIILTFFLVLINNRIVLGVDYTEINKSCVDLFNRSHFLVLPSEENWWGIFERARNKIAMEHKIFNKLWTGRFKGHVPCIIKSSPDELVVAPFKGYLADDLYVIPCRPKFDLMIWYRGYRSYSVSNRKCKRWDTQGTFTKEYFGSPLSEVQNFCRNPDSSPCGPWCFLENAPGTDPGPIREPCFPTCYSERYLNLFAPCIDREYWPYSTKFGLPYDKFYYSNVTGGGSCSLKRMSARDILRIDSYGLPHDPWGWENFPLSGYCPDGPFGYGCYSGPEDQEKFLPTYFACQDLRLDCSSKKPYHGSKDFTVSGKPCIRWSDVKFRKASQHKFKKLWKAIFSSNLVFGIKTRFDSKEFVLKEDDPNSSCLQFNHLLYYDPAVIRYFGDEHEIRYGPSCFVIDDNNELVVEECFISCHDFEIDIWNCIPEDIYDVTRYKGQRSHAINNETCLMSKMYPKDKNYCRYHTLTISCYTNYSPEVVQPCFKSCNEKKKFGYFERSPYLYSPCTEPGYRVCCENPSIVRSTTVSPVTKTTTKPSVTDSNTFLPFEPIPIPDDILNEDGTLTETRVRPTAVAEIVVAILFITGTIALIIAFYNTDLKDF